MINNLENRVADLENSVTDINNNMSSFAGDVTNAFGALADAMSAALGEFATGGITVDSSCSEDGSITLTVTVSVNTEVAPPPGLYWGPSPN